jgi:HPt (histidine-containing phosphotransfer) domain-containing protein
MSESKDSNATQPIDMSSALERIGGDESLLQELINIYIEDFLEKNDLLRKAIEHRDFITIKEIGHSLKGSSGNLSLNHLQVTSSQIEMAGKEEDIERARYHFQVLNQQFMKFIDFFPSLRHQSLE